MGIPAGDLWVFGYGSLMWNPGFPFRDRVPALVFGYHRALCIASHGHRGTPDHPGLVLGLDRGGACRGIAFRVARRDVNSTLQMLWAREMRRHGYQARLVRARLLDRQVRALAFIADLAHARYAGALTVEETARRIANCHGARGPNLDYLMRTINHLAELGVRDHNLLRVSDAVRALGTVHVARRGDKISPEADQTAAAHR